MKKKKIIIISIIAALVIIGISFVYPPADETDSAGTIGKADKYRNNKTGQEKIVLRNEFLQDSTALGATIIALAQYETYIESLSNDFSEWGKTIKEVDTKEFAEELDELNSLVAYMNNNLKTVANTRELLIKYYTKDTVDMSIDVENNLLEFSTFLTNLDKKSGVVDSLFVGLTGLIYEKKAPLLSLTSEETEKLKVVREKMLGSIFVNGYIMGNEARLNFALKSNVMDATVLNKELNIKLNFSNPFGNANQQLGRMMGREDLLMKNKNTLGVVRNTEQLNSIFIGINNKDDLGVYSNEKLDAKNKENLDNQKSLGGRMLSKELAATMKNKPLSLHCNIESLGLMMQGNKVVFSKEDFGNSASLGLMAGSMRANNQLESFKVLSGIIGNPLGVNGKGRLGLSW